MYGLGWGKKLPEVDEKYLIPPYSKNDDSHENFALPKGYQPIPIVINSTIVMTEC